MSARCLAAQTLLALIVVGHPPRASTLVPLGVMTFNIRTANGRDGDNIWVNRKGLVVDTIERSAPQLIGLQEVVGEQLEYLAASLPDYRWLGIDRGLNGGQGLSEYTPIFYRHADLSPIESGNFWLSSPPGPPVNPDRRGRGSRIVTWARLHHLASGRQVYVFNTHFTPRSGQVQLDAARIIADRVRMLPDGSPVIVTGDFNAVAEDSGVWRQLTSDRLKDAWMLAEQRRGPPVTMSGFGPPHDGDTTRIDWILVGGPIGVRSVETILHNEQGRYPSDHYPVVAQVEIQ